MASALQGSPTECPRIWPRTAQAAFGSKRHRLAHNNFAAKVEDVVGPTSSTDKGAGLLRRRKEPNPKPHRTQPGCAHEKRGVPVPLPTITTQRHHHPVRSAESCWMAGLSVPACRAIDIAHFLRVSFSD